MVVSCRGDCAACVGIRTPKTVASQQAPCSDVLVDIPGNKREQNI